MTLFTIGYEGREIAGFIECLRGAGVRVLLDVRASPRIYAVEPAPWPFRMVPLSRTLRSYGIQYGHISSLGSANHYDPSDSPMRLVDEETGMQILTDILQEGNAVAIMCAEKSHRHCHRSMIAQLACIKLPELAVQNL